MENKINERVLELIKNYSANAENIDLHEDNYNDSYYHDEYHDRYDDYYHDYDDNRYHDEI